MNIPEIKPPSRIWYNGTTQQSRELRHEAPTSDIHPTHEYILRTKEAEPIFSWIPKVVKNLAEAGSRTEVELHEDRLDAIDLIGDLARCQRDHECQRLADMNETQDAYKAADYYRKLWGDEKSRVAQLEEDAKKWRAFSEAVDEGRATATFAGRVDTISTDLEVTNAGDLHDEMVILMKAEVV